MHILRIAAEIDMPTRGVLSHFERVSLRLLHRQGISAALVRVQGVIAVCEDFCSGGVQAYTVR
jgi:hypothetical protein